jgi:F1F0 ATPase subunit 2
MNEIIVLMPALLTGLILGVVFFGGLWYTIQKGITSSHPGLWFATSLLLRTTLVISGFYLISAGNWQKLLACLCGFLIGRLVIYVSTDFGQINNTLK